MATRTKTTHWGLAPTDVAEVASDTTRTFSATTIYAPETTSRTFKSAIVEVAFSGTETTATTITAIVAGLTVNATRAAITISDSLTNSGENQGGILQFDFTSVVEANFGSGASQSFTFDIKITGIPTNNVSGTLALTYDYDDTDTTHCKTYITALHVTNTVLATSSNDYGNLVPYLTGASGDLKEDSVTIRDYYFVIVGNENNGGGTTDFALNVRLDSDAYTTFGTIERALGSDKMYRYVWSKKGAVPDTTALHSFSAYCDTASHNHLGLLLVVTYEFNASATTTVTNSVQIPYRIGQLGGTASADMQIARAILDIQEPGTISLLTSGVSLFFMSVGAITLSNATRLAIGSGSATNYTSNIATGSGCGSLVITQAFTSSDVTLARGKNYIDVKLYNSTTYGIYNFSGVIYLNYSSSVASTGVGSHNRTTYHSLLDTNFAGTTPYREFSAQALASISDTAYWLQGLGIWSWMYNVGTSAHYAHELQAEILAGEGVGEIGDGWETIYRATPTPILETGSQGHADIEVQKFMRHPSDPKEGLLGVTASRKTRMYSARWNGSICVMAVYHSITYTKAGSVSGFSGDGDVAVKIHDVATGEHLYTVSAAVGGNYSAVIYDNTRDHFSQVYEDATHVGRSSNWKAA